MIPSCYSLTAIECMHNLFSMANLLFSNSICMACLFFYANMAIVTGQSEGSLGFTFSDFRDSDKDGIKFVGDAALSNNTILLTNSSNLNQSSGRIVYNGTMQPWSIANFSTHFSFSMYPDNNHSQGDGIAFFLSNEGYGYTIPQFKIKGLFGLVVDELDVLPAVFAVAFDSRRNVVGTVGRNYSDLHYLQSATVSDLNSEKVWNAWIDYSSKTQMLDVYLSRVSQSSKSSRNHILSQRVNFSTYFKLNTVIGFSSTALNSKETHQILSWSFNSSIKGQDMKKHRK